MYCQLIQRVGKTAKRPVFIVFPADLGAEFGDVKSGAALDRSGAFTTLDEQKSHAWPGPRSPGICRVR